MLEILKQEMRHFVRDKFLVFMCFCMPFITGFIAFSALENNLKIDIGIVNESGGNISRDLIFKLDSSPMLDVRLFSDINSAKTALDSKKIYAIINIPSDFEKNIFLGANAVMDVFYNAQFVLVAKNIQSQISQLIALENISLRFSNNLKSTQNLDSALLKSIDLKPIIIALYNENSEFAKFLLPALLPCLLQLFIILCMIGFLAYDERDVGFVKNKRNEIRHFYLHLCAKIIINASIFLAWWAFMSAIFVYFGYFLHSDFYLLFLNAIVFILACCCVGIFLYALTHSFTRSISLCAVYAAPSLAFVGITYPINNMEIFATFWGKILPVTHFLQAQIKITNYGAFDGNYGLIFYNAIFVLFGILGALIYKKKLAI